MAVPVEKPLEEFERVSVEEYFRRDEASDEKYEYYDGYLIPLGQLVAMSGGSLEHGSISANIIGELRNRLRGTGCRPIDSTVRVAPSFRSRYFYPDVTVFCGEPEFDEDDRSRTTLTNPVCVFEVLSPSTEKFDRGDKFDAYRLIPTLREYVIVTQERPGVRTFFRQDDGTWLFDAFDDLSSSARLRSLGIELPLEEIYANVRLKPATDPKATTE